jgi:hypothetical protein
MPNSYKINDRQTLPDVAVHAHGKLDNLFAIALLNGLSITHELKGGDMILLPDNPDTDNIVIAAVSRRNIIPASMDDFLHGEGIDYWRIGIDFKIT